MSAPTRYQFLRDRRSWDASLVGLAPDADGYLKLASLPGPPDGIAVSAPAPFDPPPSGVAAGPCGALFVADTAGDRVIFVDGLCAAQADLRGFRAPRGLAVCGDALWVADSGHARVRRFAFPTLELDLDIYAGLKQPVGIACDGERRLYVLDGARRAIRRFGPNGAPDRAYDKALADAGKLADPAFLAIGVKDTLWVCDDAAKATRGFSAAGEYTRDLATPAGGWRPGAIAAGCGRIFVANRDDGHIHVFDDDGSWACELPGFVGPVTALAVDPANGDLLINTALDATYLRFPSGKSFAASGRLVAGPFDAGETCDWFRAACDADLPRGAALVFEVAQGADPTPPAAADWTPAPAPDTLLADLSPPGPRRFLWLRATLSTADPSVSPTLRNVRAETAGEDYRTWLPAIYTRADEPARFLFRLLALARTELGRVEEYIDAAPLWLAPDFAPVSALDWLAAWLGLELPRIAGVRERRALIARAATLWRRRGTPAGLADLIEIYAGVRPTIVECFVERGLWALDVSARLGFDTALPATSPVGMIVPDATDPLTPAEGCCATTVGSAVVGESGPLPIEDLGEPLFSDAAHRFLVFLPWRAAQDANFVANVRGIIEAEKPAHTGYDLCLVRPDMRVGLQATVGLDTIVAGPPPALRLDQSLLGHSANLPPPLGGAARIGQGARVGADATQLR